MCAPVRCRCLLLNDVEVDRESEVEGPRGLDVELMAVSTFVIDSIGYLLLPPRASRISTLSSSSTSQLR
jgi:hypothetical protein